MTNTHAGLVERMTNAIEDAGNASVQGEAYTLAIAALAAITQPLYETESAQLLEEMAIAANNKPNRRMPWEQLTNSERKAWIEDMEAALAALEKHYYIVRRE